MEKIILVDDIYIMVKHIVYFEDGFIYTDEFTFETDLKKEEIYDLIFRDYYLIDKLSLKDL